MFGKLQNLQEEYKRNHANYLFYKLLLTKRETGNRIDSEYKYCNSLQNAIDYIGAYYEGKETAILTATVLTKYNAFIYL